VRGLSSRSSSLAIGLGGCAERQRAAAETAVAKALISDDQEMQLGMQVQQELQKQNVRYLDDRGATAPGREDAGEGACLLAVMDHACLGVGAEGGGASPAGDVEDTATASRAETSSTDTPQ